MAEQERNQESVDFYRTTDQAKALVAKVPDVPVTYLAHGRSSCPRTGRWNACGRSSRPSRFSSPRRFPAAGWSRSSPPMSTWTSRLVIKEINRILEMA